MSARYQTIEVDIHDFDDETILEAARAIVNRPGRIAGLIDEPAESCEVICRQFEALASAIVSGEPERAMAELTQIARANRGIAEAVEIGRNTPRRRLA